MTAVASKRSDDYAIRALDLKQGEMATNNLIELMGRLSWSLVADSSKVDLKHAVRTAQFVLGAFMPQPHGSPDLVGGAFVTHSYGSPDGKEQESAWMHLAVNPVFANRGIGSELNGHCVADCRHPGGGFRAQMFTTVWDPRMEYFLLRCHSPRDDRPNRRWEFAWGGVASGCAYKVLRYYHPGGNDRR